MEHQFNRLPPHSIEAEQSVLGGILLENEAFPRAVEMLKDQSYFYKGAHQKIYEAMIGLFNANTPIDLLTLHDQLKKSKDINNVGGVEYLESLVELIPSAANIEYHARIVKENYLLRQLIQTTGDIYNRCYDTSSGAEDLLDYAEGKIFEVAENKVSPSFVGIKDVVNLSVKHIESLFEKKELVTGIPTGFKDVDKLTAGFHAAELIIVAGRPGMGKTAIAMNIALHAASLGKQKVAIFSLEMASEQLVIRMLCSEAKVNAQNVRTGYLSKGDWRDLTRAAAVLSNSNIDIDDTANQTVLSIRAKARRLKAERGLDLIVIDYLQLMSGTSRAENRQQEVSDITRSLKILAKELNIPIIALSQLSRATEQREGKRPQLSDLRESGSIEQDADLVMFVHRPEVYSDQPEHKGKAEVIIGKQRNGPTGTVKLAFLREFTRFDNLAHEEMYGVEE
jgi:replicative DNA helicase